MPDVIIITSPGPQGPPGPTGSSGGGGSGVGFPFSGSAVITGSLEIKYSGSNSILTLTSQSDALFQITNNTAGNLLEVNSFLNPFDLPIFYVSSSYQSEFRGPVSGSFTGSLFGTASFALNSGGGGGAGFPFTGSAGISGSLNLDGPLNIGTTNTAPKTINLGKVVTVSDAGAPTGTADQNTIIFNRNLDAQSDAIHTQINFDGRYWQYFAGAEVYDAYADTGNHYLKFTSGQHLVPSTFYDRFINLQFHTRPIDLNIAKGFSTDYNGTTYFNVTGSVSASSYFGSGRNLTGISTNPFTGSFLMTGSVIVTGSVNSTEGINGVFISEGSGSSTTNLVIGDVRALSTLNFSSAINGRNNIAIGSGSLVSATTTYRNIALGNNVLPLVTTNGANSNIGIGFDVFAVSTGGSSLTNNIAIGNSASFNATTADNNIAIGTEALFSNQSFGNNIAIGLRAGKLATGAGSSIFIGVDAGSNVTSGDNNIAIGFEALKLLTSVNNNIAIGYQAMVSGSGAQDSIAIGSSALRSITTGDDNLAIGANALATITTAAGNLAIGTDSMISSSATLASNNTSIGFQSLQNITGSNNVGIGYRTMQGFRSGSNNTVVGANNVSGSFISGSNNTIIGANVVLPDGVHNNRIIIADGRGTQIITTSGSLTTISGSLNVTGSSAIFTLQPQSPLPTVGIPTGSFAVSSSIPAKPFFWDGSVWNALY